MKRSRQAVDIPVKQIVPSPFQPRRSMTTGQIASLAESIRSSQGLDNPIQVRRVGDHYELICGHYRVEAYKYLGYAQIPAFIIEATDEEAAVLALRDNIERTNLNPLEEAEAIERLVAVVFQGDEKCAAERLGKSVLFVRDRRALLQLPPQIQAYVEDRKLSLGNALALAKVADPTLQLKAAELTVNRNWTPAELQGYLRNQAPPGGNPPPGGKRPRSPMGIVEAVSARLQDIYDLVDGGFTAAPPEVRERLGQIFASASRYFEGKALEAKRSKAER